MEELNFNYEHKIVEDFIRQVCADYSAHVQNEILKACNILRNEHPNYKDLPTDILEIAKRITRVQVGDLLFEYYLDYKYTGKDNIPDGVLLFWASEAMDIKQEGNKFIALIG